MRIIIALSICLSCAATALAVGTSHWTHTSEADFKAGTFTDVVATNLGDLKLSRAVTNLLGQDARVSAVYAITQAPDGAVYAATGPEGVLLRIDGGKVETAAEIGENTNLFSLLVDARGRLLVGTGGEVGQILRIEGHGARPQSIFRAPGVQYVWSMLQTPDGKIYAATGPTGQVHEIDPANGASRVLLDTDENNILCLLPGDGDVLYAGSDPNGLVYRINRKSGEVFVVYDAAETEVTALARDAKGNLYAATAQATEPTGEDAAQTTEQTGRPENPQPQPGVPIPSDRPAPPSPPEDVPDPSPGDPLPIPREGGVKPKSMLILNAQPDDGPNAPADDPKPDKPDLEQAAQLQQEPVGAFGGGEPAPTGNAIYRIDPDGFVTEIFRQSVLIYCMVERNGSLLVGTGTSGEIYQVNPAAEETSVLAKVDPKDVLSMLPTKDGRLLLGLANSGDIVEMSSGFAPSGTFTSPVLDAGQISRFGKIRLRGTLPGGAALKVATRSSNVAGATDAGWSPWSAEISASEFVQVPSPPARFLQYRLRFSSEDGTTSPAVEEIDVAYQLPNLPPKITSVTVTPGEVSSLTGEASPDTQQYTISWDASDPNEDALSYDVYFRAGARAPWILTKEKLNSTMHDWETRTVADGTYQVKVEANDSLANAPGAGRTSSRVSDPVVVDATAPVIGDLKSSVEGRDVKVEMKVVDRTGVIASTSYAVDSSADWQTVLPSDNIADSPEESFSFTIPGLAPGQHQVMLRALDKRGNPAFESVSVTIEK
jgi:hypothetical protein